MKPRSSSRKRAKKKGTVYKTDPNLPIVKTKRGTAEHQDHNSAVTDLVTAVWKHISQKLNYDHIELTLPRTDIKLEYGRRRYDIAYRDRHGNDVLIEVKVRTK